MMTRYFLFIFFIAVVGYSKNILPQGLYMAAGCPVIFNISNDKDIIRYRLLQYKLSIEGNILIDGDNVEFKNLYSHFYDTLENKKFPPNTKAYPVGGEFDNDSFLIQNYGNAMNPYIVFDGCDKYLRYQYINLKSIKSKIKIGRIDVFQKSFFKKLLIVKPLTPQTLTQYNNIAYYLQKAGANEEAVYLLEKIIKKFPNRTVAYINLGDAYWALGEKEKAKKAYTTYIEQMCNKGLQKKIPKEVLKRVERKDVCK